MQGLQEFLRRCASAMQCKVTEINEPLSEWPADWRAHRMSCPSDVSATCNDACIHVYSRPQAYSTQKDTIWKFPKIRGTLLWGPLFSETPIYITDIYARFLHPTSRKPWPLHLQVLSHYNLLQGPQFRGPNDDLYWRLLITSLYIYMYIYIIQYSIVQSVQSTPKTLF